MKRLLIPVLLLVVFAASCSTYSTKTVTSNSSLLKSIGNAGMIIRVSKNSKIEKDDYIKSASQWLGGLTAQKGLIILTQTSDSVSSYASEADRFYQLTEGREFLEFKSRGVINLYIRSNETELKKIMEEKKLDGLIFYEVYSIFSTEMQYMDFDSTICIVDKNLQPAFLDWQADKFEIGESNSEIIKNRLLDKISDRLVIAMKKLKFVKE
jgi:hypothetical protein